MDLNWFSLPQSATGNEFPIGYDEAGNPVRRSRLGATYTAKPQASPEAESKRALVSQMVQGLQGNPLYSLEQARTDAGRNAVPTGRDMARSLVDGAIQGFTAPGRAAAGKPVTNGDAWATALDYGALAAPIGKPAGSLGAGGIRAYHGTPHDFDKFSMDKIGTGEGAQAYGHGLYFAENEGVARGYRDALAGRIDVQPVQIDGVRYNPPSEQHQRVAAIIAKDGRRNAMETLRSLRYQDLLEPEQEAIWKKLLADTKGKDVQPLQGGRMYEVNINADPADFLDWDVPLSEQPKVAERLGFRSRSPSAVMDEMEAIMAKHGDYADAPPEIRSQLESLQAELDKPISDQTGERIYNFGNDLDFISAKVTGKGPDPDRAATLRDAGIPGIKYRDAGSRGMDGADGTRNFVVFDENLIEIVRKYGIAGAAAMTGMTVAEIEAGMGQAQAAPSAATIESYLAGL